MPGSPPTSVTEPGTRPPLSTRSTSVSPVERGCHSSVSTSAMGTARSMVAPSLDATGVGSSSSSTRVFHSVHDGQRPTHLGLAPPHSAHRKIERTFDMATTLLRGCDTAAHPCRPVPDADGRGP